MTDQPEGAATAPIEPTQPTEPAPEPKAPELGDAGKAAIAAERAARKAAEKSAAELAARVKAFEDAGKTAEQKAADEMNAMQERVRIVTARAVAAEVRALAAGQFADPSDAVAFLDPSKYAGADGEVDTATLKADLADLLKRKPHLAAAQRGPVDLGQGNRGTGPSRPSQLTRADLKSMTPDAIEKARTEGRFNDLLGIK